MPPRKRLSVLELKKMTSPHSEIVATEKKSLSVTLVLQYTDCCHRKKVCRSHNPRLTVRETETVATEKKSFSTTLVLQYADCCHGNLSTTLVLQYADCCHRKKKFWKSRCFHPRLTLIVAMATNPRLTVRCDDVTSGLGPAPL